MELTMTQKEFQESVDIVSRVVSNSATLPVLQCVVIQGGDTEVTFLATNLELGVTRRIKTKVSKPATIAIPAQVLQATLKTAPPQSSINLKTQDNTVTLTIGGATTTIKTVPVEDFPKIPDPETKSSHSIPVETFVKGVRSVLYSASTSLIKPELASVYMYHEDNNLVFVATDSFRLAEKKVPLKSSNDIPDVIMPAKNITEVVRTLETEASGEMEVFVDENQYSLTKNTLYVTARIIDGSFPDYKSILPKTTTTEAVLLKEDVLNTLKKAQVFSDKFGQVTLHLQPKEKKLTVSARNNDVGEIFDSLEAAITGDDLDISFNYRYVLDVFQSITADSVSLSFAGIGKPLIIRGVGDSSFTYLVMPMNR